MVVFIAIAIALHNIPEGIAISLPIYSSGSLSNFKAFIIALFSGLAEPIGAIIAAIILKPFIYLVPVGLAFAGGIMIFITLDELVPCANRNGHEHFTAIGIIIGVTSMFLLMGIFNI